jgi:hypothetical protein
MSLYLIAVCASCVASSFPILRFFGVALGVAFVAAHVMYTATFFSVWCFFAAAVSAMLFFHFRGRRLAELAPNA